MSVPTTAQSADPPESERMLSVAAERLILCVLAIAALFKYSWTMSYDFVLFDDNGHTYENRYLNPLTWHSFVHLWTHAYDRLYIPISYTIYGAFVALSHIGGGPGASDTGALLNPHWFHAANVALHALNVILVYLILRQFRAHPGSAFIGAYCYIAHPLVVESVAWISELRGLLSAAFGFAAILVYMLSHRPERRGNQIVSYIFVSVLMIASMLSKPSGVVFPLIALLIDRYVHRRQWKQYVVEALPWLAFAALVAVVTGGQRSSGAYTLVTPLQRTFVAGDAIGFYLGKLFWPFDLAVDYGRTPAVALADHAVYIEWLLAPSIAAVCWFTRKKIPWLSLAVLVSLAALLPVLGLVPFTFQYYSTVADRYAYVALLGPAIVLAQIPFIKDNKLQPGWLVFLVFVVVVGGVAHHRLKDWKNTQTLMTAELAVNPHSVFAHDAFGQIAYRKGNYLDALNEYRQVIGERPDLASGHYNSANCLAALGREREAEAEYVTAVQLKPDYALAYMKWGQLLLSEGKIAQARQELETARSIDPDLPGLRKALATLPR